MQGLADWWADRWDTWFFNHVCGNTVANATLAYRGHNAITAPTSGRHVWAGSNTSDAGLETTATMSLYMIDKAVEAAKVTTTGSVPPPIRPLRVDGKPWFVAFLHPYQVTDLQHAGLCYDAAAGALVRHPHGADQRRFTRLADLQWRAG